MSALTDYVTELRRQYELLDEASERDEHAEVLVSPYSVERDLARRAAAVESNKNRQGGRVGYRWQRWTRQDIRRHVLDQLVAEYDLNSLDPADDAPSLMDAGRCSSRVATLLKVKNGWLPDVRPYHARALADAAKQGVYTDLLPLVQECTAAHLVLRRAFEIGTLDGDSRDDGEPHDWNDVGRRWENAIERLEAAVPSESCDGQNPDERQADALAEQLAEIAARLDGITDNGSDRPDSKGEETRKRKEIKDVNRTLEVWFKTAEARRMRKVGPLVKSHVAKKVRCDARTLDKCQRWLEYLAEIGAPQPARGRRVVSLTKELAATVAVESNEPGTWQDMMAQGDPEYMPSPNDPRPAKTYSKHRKL